MAGNVQKARCHIGRPQIKMRVTIGTEGKQQEEPGPGPESLGHSGWNSGTRVSFSPGDVTIGRGQASGNRLLKRGL